MLLVIICSLTFSNVDSAEEKQRQFTEKKPLRISIMSVNYPFSMLPPNGKPIGLYVDIWKLWSDITGIPIVFLPEKYSKNIEALKQGNADFHAGLFINTKRLEWADFSLPIHSIPTHLFVNENADFSPTFAHLSNKIIGVGEDSFQDYFLTKKNPEIEKKVFEDYEQVLHSLLIGDVDGIISEAPFVDAQLAAMGIRGAIKRSRSPVTINTVHAMIPKGNEYLIEVINQGISKIPKSELIKLEKKWLPNYSPYFSIPAIDFLATLTVDQQMWLRKLENLTFGYNPDLAPFEFEDGKNKYSGIGAEYLEVISELLNIRMEPSVNESWSNTLASLQERRIDLLTTINFHKEMSETINFSDVYMDFPNVVVTKTHGKYIQNIEDLAGNKVAVVDNYQISKTMQEFHPNISLVLVKNVTEGMSKVEVGEVTAYIDNLVVVSHHIREHNLERVKISSFTPYSSRISFGIRKGLEPLIPIINKALSSISKQKKDAIVGNWLAYQINQNANIIQIIYWSFAIFLFSSGIIGYVVLANRKMKSEIRYRIDVEQNLEKETILTQRMNNAKDEFLSNMSHEIRTPMNAIMGTANLLTLSGLDDEQSDYLDTINSSADVLLHLIDEILDLSEITHNEAKLNLTNFRLKELFESLIKQAGARIKNNKVLSIRYDIASEIPDEIHGDPMRLGQLVTNFLSNALKFTEQGSIVIRAHREYPPNLADDEIKLIFCVEDTGIGMSKVQQKILFQAYTQADLSTSRKYGGTGLGLSICKSISNLMNGEVWVESELGRGSRFYFSAIFQNSEKRFSAVEKDAMLSVDKSVAKKEGLTTKPDPKITDKDSIDYYSKLLSNKNILIVDDNQINLTIAKKMLEKVGVNVTTAMNGVESLERLNKGIFDAVLMDLQMPIMDGYQATKIIRENQHFENLVIIAFSANVMKKDVANALASGMNAHLPKPLKLQTLLKLLSKQLNLEISVESSLTQSTLPKGRLTDG